MSLKRLDPLALVKLKAAGECEFEVPEWVFDLETPGLYMRRIKTVSLSVPCVTGPYAGVSCKLTLLRHEVRHSSEAGTGYQKATTGDDPRFTVRSGASESIVTSSGRDDSGLFETLLRDDRYLPFESAGAVSRWRLELPKGTSELDFDTISDVILHVRYTVLTGHRVQTGDRPRPRRLRRRQTMRWKDSPRAVLLALLVIHVLAHIDRNMLLGFSPQITEDLALSNAQYGFLAGAVWVLSFGVMALFMGSIVTNVCGIL